MGESQVLKHSHTHSLGGGFKYGIIILVLTESIIKLGMRDSNYFMNCGSEFKEKFSYLQTAEIPYGSSHGIPAPLI